MLRKGGIVGSNLKGPCSPKRLCAFVLLFWPGSFVECMQCSGSVLFPKWQFSSTTQNSHNAFSVTVGL